MVEIAADLLLDARVRDIHGATSRKVATTGPGSTVPELLEKMRAHPRSRHIYVVDDAGMLVGAIGPKSVIRHLFPHDTLGVEPSAADLLGRLTATSAKDIMNTRPAHANDDADLSELARLMNSEGIDELPVLDARGRVVGVIDFLDVVAEYLTRRKRLLKGGS